MKSSQVLCDLLSEMQQGTQLFAVREQSTRLGILLSNLCQVFTIYIYEVYRSVFHVYRDVQRLFLSQTSGLFVFKPAQPECDRQTQWSDRAHLSSVHPMANVSPDTLPQAAFVRQRSRRVEFSISPLKPDGEEVALRIHTSRCFPTKSQQTHRQEKKTGHLWTNVFLLVGL